MNISSNLVKKKLSFSVINDQRAPEGVKCLFYCTLFIYFILPFSSS